MPRTVLLYALARPSSSTLKSIATFSAVAGFTGRLGGEHETIRENWKWSCTESNIGNCADRKLGLPGSGHSVGEAASGCGIWTWRARRCTRLLCSRALLAPRVRRSAISLRLLRATASLLGCTAALLALNARLAGSRFNVKTKAPRATGALYLFRIVFCQVSPRQPASRLQIPQRSAASRPDRAAKQWELREDSVCKSGTA